MHVTSWCRQVNWGNCGIPWVNCAVICVWKITGKDSSEACVIACQNRVVYSVFPSGMTSHSKITQFNWECIGCLRSSNLIWMIIYPDTMSTVHNCCVLQSSLEFCSHRCLTTTKTADTQKHKYTTSCQDGNHRTPGFHKEISNTLNF
jgi:hypothetical protein